MAINPDLTFEPPGPGTWMLDSQHFPNGLSGFDGGLTAAGIGTSNTKTSARYGLLNALTGTTVNNFVYIRSEVVGVPPGATEAPSLSHPEVKDRLERAREVVQTRYWRDELREFSDVVKPDSIRRNLSLAAIDVSVLADHQLIQHVATCRENVELMVGRHHQLNVCAMLPVGMFIANVVDWTGTEPIEVVPVLSGASPISAGITPQLIALVEAIRGDRYGLDVISSDESGSAKIAKLRELQGAVGNAAERYALIDGHWLATGLDVSDRYNLELSDALVARISELVESGIESVTPDLSKSVERLRDQIPERHKNTFDSGLNEAHAHLEIKDERGLYQDMWAKGIARKALLEAGTRLGARGLLSDPEHIIEAAWSEFPAVWNENGLTGDELSARREARMSLTWRDAPAFLGPPPTPPTPPEGLPVEMASMMRALAITRPLIGLGQPMNVDAVELSGMVASRGTYEGTARVAVGDYDFSRIQRGDVLVTSTHSEAYTAVSSRVGAIVTDTGGVLSHLSVISREMSIPSIVACKDATIVIKDGDRILVDAENGVVTVLESTG